MIIDSHTHILPDEFRRERARILKVDATFAALFSAASAKTADAEALIASMDRAGVDVSVAAGYGWTDEGVARLANDYALDAARRHPGRIFPFCSANPLKGDSAAREVRRCAEAGVKGIGELHPDTQGFSSSDPAILGRLAPLMDAARAFHLPVLVHASEPLGHAYPGKGTFTPDKALALAQAYPANVLIFAHFGGGLPFHALMPEVARSLGNVYFDSAAQPFLYTPSAYAATVAAAGGGRVLFASDFPLTSQQRALKAARAGGLDGPDEVRVFGANAARLLGVF